MLTLKLYTFETSLFELDITLIKKSSVLEVMFFILTTPSLDIDTTFEFEDSKETLWSVASDGKIE